MTDMLARALDRPVPSGPVARLLDPETSKDAGRQAVANPERLAALQREVLGNLARAHARDEDGLTDFEHAYLQTSAGKRRSELQRAGLVEWTGTRRPTPNGGTARVYRITDAGLYAYRGMPLGTVA